jgi:phospholipid/cholesterol/gamma-HCH transport system substrate-binding protein
MTRTPPLRAVETSGRPGGRSHRRLVPALAAAVVAVLAASGCSLDGRGDLPFARGTGEGSYTLTVHMADVGTLVPHAEVKVNDVTVGTVTSITMRDWQAVVTVSLEPSAWLPADTVANVGQKSLLGAQYLQLTAPTGADPRQDGGSGGRPGATPGVARLGDGDVIPIERTGAYPSTEDLLITLATFLNGAGLNQLRTIMTQMNLALDGRTDDVRALLTHLRQLMDKLAAQRATMVQLLDRMNTLSGVLAKDSSRIARSLPALGSGLAALNGNRPALMNALTAVEQLDAVADPVLRANTDQLVTDIEQLREPLSRIADAGDKAVDSLNIVGTIVYPLDRVPILIRGDYMNLFMNIDARAEVLKSILGPCTTVYCKGERGRNVTTSTTGLFAPTTVSGART